MDTSKCRVNTVETSRDGVSMVDTIRCGINIMATQVEMGSIYWIQVGGVIQEGMVNMVDTSMWVNMMDTRRCGFNMVDTSRCGVNMVDTNGWD